MTGGTEVFISHHHSDETLALLLKDLIEDTFLNLSVFISGRDLTGGDIWIAELRDRLRTARLIVSIITQYSIDSGWVLFESGAGFINSKCIPVCADQITIRRLRPPLNQLHARQFTDDGLGKLIKDIAKTLGIRAPKQVQKLSETIQKANEFISLRKSETLKDAASNSSQTARTSSTKQYDTEFAQKISEMEKELRARIIRNILEAADKYDVPKQSELVKMSLNSLSEVASAFNVIIPRTALLQVFQLQLDKLEANAPAWRKMNHEKKLAAARKTIDTLTLFGV